MLMRGRSLAPVVLPKMPASFKLIMQVRFRRPLHPPTAARSTVMSQDTGMAVTLTGYRASLDGRDADGTVRSGLDGTEDEMGLNAGDAPHCRTRTARGPLAAGPAHRGRPECRQGPRMRHGAGQ